MEIMSKAARLATEEDLFAIEAETDRRFEIIHGELLQKPLHAMDHSAAQQAFAEAIGRRFKRAEGGRWPGGWWLGVETLVKYETSEMFRHDVVGWRRTTMPVRPRTEPVLIRPDWACEILSRGHERRDRLDKLRVLQAAGVPHYWIVDHDNRTVAVHRWQIEGYLL